VRPENLLWGKPEIPDRGYFTFARNHSKYEYESTFHVGRGRRLQLTAVCLQRDGRRNQARPLFPRTTSRQGETAGNKARGIATLKIMLN